MKHSRITLTALLATAAILAAAGTLCAQPSAPERPAKKLIEYGWDVPYPDQVRQEHPQHGEEAVRRRHLQAAGVEPRLRPASVGRGEAQAAIRRPRRDRVEDVHGQLPLPLRGQQLEDGLVQRRAVEGHHGQPAAERKGREDRPLCRHRVRSRALRRQPVGLRGEEQGPQLRRGRGPGPQARRSVHDGAPDGTAERAAADLLPPEPVRRTCSTCPTFRSGRSGSRSSIGDCFPRSGTARWKPPRRACGSSTATSWPTTSPTASRSSARIT